MQTDSDARERRNRLARERYQRDPELFKERSRRWSATHPERSRAYQREKYARNSVAYRAQQAVVRARNTTDLRALKLLRGCADCGYSENADALQFDHLPQFQKLANLAVLKSSNQMLAAEIAKCEVVCANCHAIRTATRAREVRRVA